MAAGTHNIYVEQGATFERTLIFKDADDELIDLTGDVFRGQIRKRAGDETVLAEFTCTVKDQLASTGQVTIALTAADTAAIPSTVQRSSTKVSDTYVYDLERVVAGSGAIERILEGTVTFSPEVTVEEV